MDSTSPSLSELWEQNRPLLPMYLHLILAALFPIYTGAHASLSRPSSAAKPVKNRHHRDEDDDEEETIQQMEGLTPRDALIFPITAGIVLSGLYFLIKRYGAGIINTVLGVYFSLIGTYSVGKLINDSWTLAAGVLMPTYYKNQGKIWKVLNNERKVIVVVTDAEVTSRTSPLVGTLGLIPLPRPVLSLLWSMRDVVQQKFKVKGYAKNLFDFQAILTRHNLVSALLGVAAISYALFVDKPWWLTNLQGFAVSYGALQLMSPTTFTTGTLILAGLFCYDIWAVFFTPLMVTVAKNLDVPIKLVFPRPEEAPATPGGPIPPRNYSMLGLGDIVLPGLVIGLALRFDLYMFYLRQQKKVTKIDTGDVNSDNHSEVLKAPYITAGGHWGDKFWSGRAASPILPAYLSTSFPKTYFHASLVGYIVGLLATLVFMAVFHHAQPALLYLVPGVLISTWGTALVRGEVKHMWEFTEAADDEPIESDAHKDEQIADKENSSSGFFSDLQEFFGMRSASPTDPKAKSKDERSDGTTKSGGTTKDDQKLGDADTVFSFSISNHTSKQSSTNEDLPPNPGNGPSSSESDDAVLVSQADLDGSRYVDQPRLRSSTRRKGKS